VEEDLPKLVEAMKKRQREVGIITTDVKEVNPLNERVLRTAAKLGIRKYRLMHWQYKKDRSIAEQLGEMAAKFRDLAALNKELGIQGGYQNHSGVDYMGAPVWDVFAVLKEFDPQFMAMHFDIGHATLEGGMSWTIQARLVQPMLGAVYVKDFYWEKGANGWRSQWCPLGQGMIKRSFIDELKKSAFAGPISQHHEYYEAGASREKMLPGFKKDLEVLRGWLA
jgi:sugar phosphate isomerase/epimerase